jgi:hypothetical protein
MNETNRSGGNRRRPFKRKSGDQNGKPERKGAEKPRYDKTKGTLLDRPQWIPPKAPSQPLPKAVCPYCEKAIPDLSAAITDKASGTPAHFDCVIQRISEMEQLGPGDGVTYIGGGRFGILHFNNPNDLKSFQIKKVVQWEEKDKRAPWRVTVAEYFSAT